MLSKNVNNCNASKSKIYNTKEKKLDNSKCKYKKLKDIKPVENKIIAFPNNNEFKTLRIKLATANRIKNDKEQLSEMYFVNKIIELYNLKSDGKYLYEIRENVLRTLDKVDIGVIIMSDLAKYLNSNYTHSFNDKVYKILLNTPMLMDFNSIREIQAVTPTKHTMILNDKIITPIDGKLQIISKSKDIAVYNNFMLDINYISKADINNAPFTKGYINTSWQGELDLFLTVLGLALMPMADRIAGYFLLYGNGKNGKSVFIELLQRLIPSKNIASVPLQKLEAQFSRQPFINANINLVDDNKEGKITNSGTFKAMTSGGIFDIEAKGENLVSISKPITMIISINNLPVMQDNSFGAIRRCYPIPFTREITEDEAIPNLVDKLYKEKDIIVSMAIDKLIELYNNDVTELTLTEDMKKLRDELFANQDIETEILNDFFNMIEPVEKEETNSSKNHIKTTDLYFEYCNLCVNNGISPLSNKVFAMKLSTYCKKNKIIKQKINNINGYYCKINR